jgi:hypothetical protein
VNGLGNQVHGPTKTRTLRTAKKRIGHEICLTQWEGLKKGIVMFVALR